MKEVTYENFTDELSRRAFKLRECSICNTPLIMIGITQCEFNPASLPEDTVALVDTNCDCVRYTSSLKPLNRMGVMQYIEGVYGNMKKLENFINGGVQ